LDFSTFYVFCWCGYLSGARFRLFAYDPADVTAVPKSHHLLPHLNPDWFYLSGTGLPGLSWKRGRYWLNGCSSSNSSSGKDTGERLPRHQTRRRRRRRKWRKVYYALRRTEALSDTPIRPSVCPSPGRAAALGYRYAGCLQLSHVRSADMSAEGRIDPPRVELSSAEGISCCRPGAITCFIGVVRTAAERPSYTSTALLQRNV